MSWLAHLAQHTTKIWRNNTQLNLPYVALVLTNWCCFILGQCQLAELHQTFAWQPLPLHCSGTLRSSSHVSWHHKAIQQLQQQLTQLSQRPCQLVGMTAGEAEAGCNTGGCQGSSIRLAGGLGLFERLQLRTPATRCATQATQVMGRSQPLPATLHMLSACATT